MELKKKKKIKTQYVGGGEFTVATLCLFEFISFFLERHSESFNWGAEEKGTSLAEIYLVSARENLSN